MRSLIAIAVLSISILALSSQASRACSCVPPKEPLIELKNADAVFSGTVVRISTTRAGRLRAVIEVKEIWKGIDSHRVIVITQPSSAACGFPFRKNQAFLIYAEDDEEELTTNLCTRSQPLDRAKEDLKALGEGESPE